MSRFHKFSLSLLFVLFTANSTIAQPLDDAQLKELMLKNWERIEDYEVDIKLALDIPGFRMPSKKIHYMYKAPDKSKVEVKGFAIVPKQGIQPFITFLRDSVDLQIVADTIVNEKAVFEVALEDTFMNQVGRISFYVDKSTGSVYQAWVMHEDQEFFRMTSEYELFEGSHLPVKTEIQMTFPPEFRDMQALGKKPTDMQDFDAQRTSDWITGYVNIQFKNYKVNRGIPDWKFEDGTEDAIQD